MLSLHYKKSAEPRKGPRLGVIGKYKYCMGVRLIFQANGSSA